MKKETNSREGVALFEEKVVRRAWHNEQWYFVIVDVVAALTDSVQAEGYVKDMGRRDTELSKGWGQIATLLSIKTKGGIQAFKLWLAKVGQEPIEEIQIKTGTKASVIMNNFSFFYFKNILAWI